MWHDQFPQSKSSSNARNPIFLYSIIGVLSLSLLLLLIRDYQDISQRYINMCTNSRNTMPATLSGTDREALAKSVSPSSHHFDSLSTPSPSSPSSLPPNSMPIPNARWYAAYGPQPPINKTRVEEILARPGMEQQFVEYCREIMMGESKAFTEPGGSWKGNLYSQADQEWFIYHNYFRHKVGGWYLDLGSNEPFSISNTLFFDKCLGWKGLCIEPSGNFADDYAKRSCKWVQTCVLGKKQKARLENPSRPELSGVIPDEANGLQCYTMSEILDAHNITESFDFVSLDIEGAEEQVLQCMDFERVNALVWTIEVNKVDRFHVDELMRRAGYLNRQGKIYNNITYYIYIYILYYN